MKIKNIILLLLTSMLFTGCETIEGIFCPHECDENCNPICLYEANKENIKSQDDWKNFKNYKKFTYSPYGKPIIDSSLEAYKKISEQLYTEVIIPYIESDADGTLADYRMFKAIVEEEMERQNLTMKEASTLVIDEIKRTKPDQYKNIMASFAIIENRDFMNQFGKILESTIPEIISIITTLTLGGDGDNKITNADLIKLGFNVLPELNKGLNACQFLIIAANDSDQSNEQLIGFVKEHEDFGEKEQ